MWLAERPHDLKLTVPEARYSCYGSEPTRPLIVAQPALGISDPRGRYANLAAVVHDPNLIGLDVAADCVDVDIDQGGWQRTRARRSVATPPTASFAAHFRVPILRDATVATFVQVDKVEFVAGFPDIPSDPAVVVLNPDEAITPESFATWLDRRQAGQPVDPGVRAADTLAEARAAGDV